MKAAKFTLTSTILAAAFGLTLALTAAPAEAKPNCDDPPCGGAGGNPKSESNDKLFPVKVTFDDAGGDSIQSDGGGDYINDVDFVSAKIPVEGTPAGQFLFWLGEKGDRTLFIDFGGAVDCPDPNGETLGCVVDMTDATVVCPFPVGERSPDDNECSGLRKVTINFRHAFDDDDVDNDGDLEEYMLDMPTGVPPNGVPFDGEASLAENYEIGFKAEKNVGGWRLRFDEMCLGLSAPTGEFLEITATDNETGDELPNDEWQIGTGEGMKTACLTKTVKGNPPEELIGLFDMRFGYTVCILADPDVSDLCIIGE